MYIATLTRLLTCALVLALWPITAPAQVAPKQRKAAPPAACDQTRALLLVEQQAAEARSFGENPTGQIAIMLRAADVLWPHKPDAARAVFKDAFDLAAQYFRQRGDETRTEGRMMIQLPDQRFKVLGAIARRDAAWARRLAEGLADEAAKQTEPAGAVGQNSFTEIGTKLVELADSLLSIDRETALVVARNSLRQPASYLLPRFLYRLAEKDQGAADQFYKEALSAYASRAVQDLLYLSVYPFAFRRVVGPVRVSMPYEPPVGFAANAELQRLYLEALLRQFEAKLSAQAQPVEPNVRRSEPELILAALTVLEPVVGERYPALGERVTVLKATANALLAPTAQRSATSFAAPFGREPAEADEGSFARSIETAERTTDPDRRDQFLSMAVTGAVLRAELSALESAAQKIADPATRRETLNALYFARAQKAIKDGLFDDAARLLARVDAPGERALLALQLAEASIKQLDDSQRARESLEAALKVAQGAPNTNEKARALLGVASLYAKFDNQRAFEVLGEAVKAINQVAAPQLDDPVLNRHIEGKTFGYYTSSPAPAFTLESAFRDLGPADFEGVLGHARALNEPVLRATAIVALSAKCLEPTRPGAPVKQGAPGPKKVEPQAKPAASAKPPH